MDLVERSTNGADLSLASARTALEDASDVSEVAALVDRLEVVRVAARKAKLPLDAQNDWATVKLEAERKAGSMLAELRRAGELRAGRPNADVGSALANLRISQQQSSRWQRLAAIPQPLFETWLRQVRDAGGEVTETALSAVAARLKDPPRPYVRPAILSATAAPRNVLLEADCLDVLPDLPDASIDALITDPPAAVSFMGVDWDDDRGGRRAWVAWMTEVMREVLRVLKPGAYALVWSLPRTSHWTAWALEDAGFEIRDAVIHVFAQGMPKSGDISAAVGELDAEAAEAWSGFAQTLKPAHETWWLARKPTDLSTAENVLAWGAGALNVEATRIAEVDDDGGSSHGPGPRSSPQVAGHDAPAQDALPTSGRWPANVVLTDPVFDGEPEVVGVVGGGQSPPGSFPAQRGNPVVSRFGADSKPTKGGPRQAGDAGGRSRYFLVPKASSRDRNTGVDGEGAVENTHIATKPLELMRHFVRLIAPPGGLVLDPFAGSGTTGVACALERADFVLVERDAESAAIARARLGLAEEPPASPGASSIKAT